MSQSHDLDTHDHREVRARRISFGFTLDGVEKHFMKGDIVMSHIVATLSSYFPPGEDFFVASVRNYRDQVTDPWLRKQVGGFIGQEAIHSREHDELNTLLDKAGYHTRISERGVRRGLTNFGGKVLPKAWQLAITAALEHYTATLAEVLMTSQRSQDMFGSDEVRNLLLWHALEESEHKAVAYDVYQQCVGDNRLRVRIMKVVTVVFIGAVAIDSFISMLFDRDFYRFGKTFASLRRLRSNPWLTKEVWARLKDYDRPDFHPDDHDTTALTDHWASVLFGETGTLSSKLKVRAAA